MKVISDCVVEGFIKFYYCFYVLGCRLVIKDLVGLLFFDIERKIVVLEFEILMNLLIWIVSF